MYTIRSFRKMLLDLLKVKVFLKAYVYIPIGKNANIGAGTLNVK